MKKYQFDLPIGTKFKIGEFTYMVSESEDDCDGCDFVHGMCGECHMINVFPCEKEHRNDNRNVIFKDITDE